MEWAGPYLMTESVLLHPGMEEAFSPGEPRTARVLLMSTSVAWLMEYSITSGGISGVSPWASSASRYPGEHGIEPHLMVGTFENMVYNLIY